MEPERGARERYRPPGPRLDGTHLERQTAEVVGSPILGTLLEMSQALLAVLNDRRQVLAANQALLASLGLEDAGELLGLRPGEVLGCEHAAGLPDGCGTTEQCSSCGAAVAIAVTLAKDRPTEGLCTISRGADELDDLFFRVQAYPFEADSHRLVLLYLQDVSRDVRSSMLERVFFHDVNNLAATVVGHAELLALQAEDPATRDRAGRILGSAQRLVKEIAIQRFIHGSEGPVSLVRHEPIAVAELVDDLVRQYGSHPEAAGKRLEARAVPADLQVEADRSLLFRVLGNMVVNALEASEIGDTVRLAVDREPETVTFSVWNRAPIPETVAARVFHRSFTTKRGVGRGLGTYSMKLLGESCLGGRVDFRTSPESGTEFRFRLPLATPGSAPP